MEMTARALNVGYFWRMNQQDKKGRDYSKVLRKISMGQQPMNIKEFVCKVLERITPKA